MRTVRFGAGIGALVAGLVIAGAGCGDDDKDNNGSSQPSTSAVDPDPLGLEIQAVTIPDGDTVRPVVRFRVTDGAGNPIDLNAEITNANGTPAVSYPNTVPRFTLAQLDDRGNYTSYYASTVQPIDYPTTGFGPDFVKPPAAAATQATAQPSYSAASATNRNPVAYPIGDLRAIGNGVFELTLPATQVTALDRTKTHTLAGWVVRQLSQPDSDVAYSSFNFVPAGTAQVQTWDVVTDQACNRCHGRLQFHGTRRGVQLCITCHSPQTTDPETSRTLDFKVLVHKIHLGGDLPSVRQGKPYFIVGRGGAIEDFSDVAFPFHDGVQHCTVCHEGGAKADNWRQAPSITACTSCHDNVKFEATEGVIAGCGTLPANKRFQDCIHTGGFIATSSPHDSQQCLGCHTPGSGLGVDKFHHGGK